MPHLNLAQLRLDTEAEGPGRRIAVWVQGCRRACPGCCNPEMQPLEENHIISVEDLTDRLDSHLKQNPEIEGISLLGGEPILQAEGLSALAAWARRRRLTVLLFTGFLYEELKNHPNPHVQALLAHTDLIVDGPFMQDQYDTSRSFIGSANQRIIRLTDAYPEGIEYRNPDRAVEIRFTGDEIQVNGWPLDQEQCFLLENS